jgi:phosphatidylglycerol:prolipoprotein diacylglycerol transferase
MLALVHPVLIHIGSIVIPAYGALAALGALLALIATQSTARIAGIDPNKIWNLCIVALFTALVGSRILLILVNWSVLRSHPLWMLGLAMIHHPELAGAGAILALAVAFLYARRQQLPLRATADALAAPVALGLGFEQIGALLAGSGYGTETAASWAVTYTNPLAARWSGAPIGVSVHPVQAYAALGFFLISICLVLLLPRRRQHGDVAGICLLTMGACVYVTEFWRDPEGRGALLGGFLNGPQVAAIVLVLAGAVVLLERKAQSIDASSAQADEIASNHTEPSNSSARNEAAHG